MKETAMKKNEFSELASNLLIIGSVSLAFAPFVLGDRLVLIVTGLMREGGLMFDLGITLAATRRKPFAPPGASGRALRR